jgi:hypothetical protein
MTQMAREPLRDSHFDPIPGKRGLNTIPIASVASSENIIHGIGLST